MKSHLAVYNEDPKPFVWTKSADDILEILRVGGTLVMPVGGPWRGQSLVRLRRAPNGVFAREELGAVRFVPLIEDGRLPPGKPSGIAAPG